MQRVMQSLMVVAVLGLLVTGCGKKESASVLATYADIEDYLGAVDGFVLEQQVIRPAVEVRCGNHVGSGTVIRLGSRFSSRLYVLTAAHVVADSVEARRQPPVSAVMPWADGCCPEEEEDEGPTQGRQQPHRDVTIYQRIGGAEVRRGANVIAYSPCELDSGPGRLDLALLEPDSEYGLVEAELAPVLLRPGEPVWVCGSGDGLYANLFKSIVNRPLVKYDLGSYVAINGEGWYGHSGSGVFVRRDGKFVLAGVLVQVEDPLCPRSPVLCRTPEDVYRFLRHYYPALFLE